MRWVERLFAGASCLALAACTLPGIGPWSGPTTAPTVVATSPSAPPASSTGSPTPPTSAPAPTADPWSGNVNTQRIGTPPAFPAALDGWRRTTTWTVTERAFEGEWSAVSGPDYAAFPASMNSCGDALTLVRWRAIDRQARIRVSWQHATSDPGTTTGTILTANAGWLTLDGCQVPMLQFATDPYGDTLADVVLELRQYEPAV